MVSVGCGAVSRLQVLEEVVVDTEMAWVTAPAWAVFDCSLGSLLSVSDESEQ